MPRRQLDRALSSVKISSGMAFLQDPFCTEGVRAQGGARFSAEVEVARSGTAK